ncbi:outer membrane protein [Bartonella sp. CB74]|uniref:outer membrane protein n=1 Tax=Bartonella sp. CB74 TaxID=3113620 RepID=UPI002F966756
MNTKRLVTASVFALISASAAQAADVVIPHQPAPAVPSTIVAPTFTWTGFYFGGQVGGFSSKTDMSITGENEDALLNKELAPKPSGFVGGFYAGSNIDLGDNFIFGIDTDLMLSGRKHTKTITLDTFNDDEVESAVRRARRSATTVTQTPTPTLAPTTPLPTTTETATLTPPAGSEKATEVKAVAKPEEKTEEKASLAPAVLSVPVAEVEHKDAKTPEKSVEVSVKSTVESKKPADAPTKSERGSLVLARSATVEASQNGKPAEASHGGSGNSHGYHRAGHGNGEHSAHGGHGSHGGGGHSSAHGSASSHAAPRVGGKVANPYASHAAGAGHNAQKAADGKNKYNVEQVKNMVSSFDIDQGENIGTFSHTLKQHWFGATRLRIGFAADRIMPYVAGGVAYTQLQDIVSVSFKDPDGKVIFSKNLTDETKTMVGYTFGGGVDFAMTDNILVRAEYRYSDFGKKKFAKEKFEINFKTNDFRVGVAYKF